MKTKQYRPRWNDKVIPYIKEIKKLNINEQIQFFKNTLDNISNGNQITEDTNDINKTLESKISNRIKTLDDLINVAKIDLNEWIIDRHVINKWDVGSNIDDQIVVEELFQVKVWLKKNVEFVNAQQVRKNILKEIKEKSPKIKKINYKETAQNNLLEINIFDLHFGKLCSAQSSQDDYNTDIARERFLKALNKLILRSKSFEFEKILFPIGNDFFNSDNHKNETTKGTPQDEHLLWQETVKKGRQLMQIGIEYLTMFAPVHVVVVNGNHDWQRMFMLGEMLEGWFHNNQNVTIDNSFKARKYFKYGKCLIGFTHGNNEKAADLPLIMAQEQSQNWQDTKYREFHLGHLHHKRDIKYKSSQAYKGIVIRYLRSLGGEDTWHNIKGYVGSIQSAESFIWNKDEGLIANFSHNL
ncbi:MAG: hypothetical protein Unbinned2716contig1000_48 [Prokaryotic dsDNA virus sp.]|nr:MAG: hypothetical protein Unbinned2716contig1000_48 [Prokaryotic dsDNA virus sp.]|tara:strand:+ start:5480 stop:6712 length:1233 start_codon:yes stop_codon:yes gene_type:complete